MRLLSLKACCVIGVVAVVAWPTVSLLTSSVRMMFPSGVICGVTSSLRSALRNAIEVAPLEVATW